MYTRILSRIFIFAIFSTNAFATNSENLHSHLFTPFVSIFKNHENGINIEAPKTVFLAVYNSRIKTFNPITIPFTVKSTTEEPINYRLRLALSSHYCKDRSQLDWQEWQGIRYRMDRGDFIAPEIKVELSEVTNVLEQLHVLDVNYPALVRLNEPKECAGKIGIIAEMIL